MSRWTGIVVASPGTRHEAMVSRLPSYLHPIAGRPLIWHAVAQTARAEPERLIVVAGADVPVDIFTDVSGPPVTVLRHDELGDLDNHLAGDHGSAVVVLDASAFLSQAVLTGLVGSARGSWIPAGDSVVAARLDPQLAPEVLRVPTPLHGTRGVLTPAGRLPESAEATLVRDRRQLATVAERVRDRIVAGHMAAGVTFLLPASVLVDVDARIGADTMIYPGVVIEGETTVGEETVIGPGCRIIDSWIGSGVEMKGWNYVSHTSVRNRAILEPYVRRGFD